MDKKTFSILDTFFKIPVRMNSTIDNKRRREAQDVEPTPGVPSQPIPEPPFVIGFRRIPYTVAKNLHWEDSFMDDREIEDIDKKGFDHTQIMTPDGEYITCAWKREKFEEKFSTYLEDMEVFLDAREEIASKKRAEENQVLFMAIKEEDEASTEEEGK